MHYFFRLGSARFYAMYTEFKQHSTKHTRLDNKNPRPFDTITLFHPLRHYE